NGVGGTLPPGSNDLNWEKSDALYGTYTPAIVMANPPGNYINSPWPDCAWIAHQKSRRHSGNKSFFYKIEFELPCTDLCGESYDLDSTYCLNLDFFSDNSVYEIYVNGVPQSPHIASIPVANPYTYTGFQNSSATS